MKLFSPNSPWRAIAPAALAGGGTALLHACAFPNINAWWAGLACLVPMILWAYARPSAKRFLCVGFLAFWFSWAFLLLWLRHVHPFWGWFGVGFLAFFNACFATLWLAALHWTIARCDLDRPAFVRLISILGLSACWVVLEWVRGWLFTGFPWLPLAASQWIQPVFLQLCEWTGAWGVSFLLVFINLCAAGYLRSLYALIRPGTPSLTQKRVRVGGAFVRLSFHMELYLGLLALLGCAWLMVGSIAHMHQKRLPLFEAGMVQPWLDPNEKWSPENASRNWNVLKAFTLSLKPQSPDLYLWPEAATPWAILGPQTEAGRALVESLVADLDAPLLTGNLSVENDRWYNGIYLVDPKTGVSSEFYAKRHLVPFGEYVPLQKWFPFISKISPVQGSFYPGESAKPLAVSLNDGRTFFIGPLVCYEDIFPSLSRELTGNGAQVLFVATNNAWYGTEAGAYQHAAHSVLRAVENRRPLVRCGNNGWSGWIDEFGYAGALEEMPDGTVSLVSAMTASNATVYFRGAGMVRITASPYYAERITFFVRHGDWFVYACIGLCVLAALRLRFGLKIR